MKFNFDLFIDILWLGTLSGVISTVCLQKIKSTNLVINHRYLCIFIHFIIGFSISRLFTNLSIKLCIATGFITWIGAETIYDKLSSKKLFSGNLSVNKSEDINNNKESEEEFSTPNN